MNAVTKSTDKATPSSSFEATAYHPTPSPEGSILTIKDFNLWYGKAQALHQISMNVERGLVTALIGPSGCGKSTLLRCFNRMNDLIDELRIAGKMQVGDQDIYRAGPALSRWFKQDLKVI